MAKVKRYSIAQINCIGECTIIAKNVDVFYSTEICRYLKSMHPQLDYYYNTDEYIKANPKFWE